MTDIIMAEFWGIVVGTILAFAAGMIWYNPKIFGTMWTEEQPHRKMPDDFKDGMVPGMVASVFDAFIIACLAALLMASYGFNAVGLLALGLIAGTYAFNTFRGGTTKIWLIDVGFGLTQLVLILIALHLF